MSVQPVSPAAPAPVSPHRTDVPSPTTSGVMTALVGALLLQFARVLQIGNSGLESTWDSWIPVVLPALALPAALLWWTRSPVVAQRLLPLIVGIALVPVAVLVLVPTVAGAVPDVIVTVVAMAGSAAIWTVTGLVVIGAAALASSGRVVAAAVVGAAFVLAGLLVPTALGSIRALELPTQVYPLVVLTAAIALIVGASMTPRSAGDRPAVPARTALGTALGALAIVIPSLVTYFVLSRTSGGPRVMYGWIGGVGVALVIVSVVGATLLGRQALLLVAGAGLLIGCLYALTSAVGAGLGRDWWLPVLLVLVLVAAVAVAMVRAAREIGLTTIAALVVVLVTTHLIVEFGHLDEGAEIALTFAGLLAGALAGGSIIGAIMPRLACADHLVPVLLLALALGSGVSQVFSWAFEATDISRNTSLLWICAVLVLAAVAVALWPKAAPRTATTALGSPPAEWSRPQS